MTEADATRAAIREAIKILAINANEAQPRGMILGYLHAYASMTAPVHKRAKRTEKPNLSVIRQPA